MSIIVLSRNPLTSTLKVDTQTVLQITLDFGDVLFILGWKTHGPYRCESLIVQNEIEKASKLSTKQLGRVVFSYLIIML